MSCILMMILECLINGFKLLQMDIMDIKISLWRPTHTVLKQSEQFRITVQQFHCYLRKSASLKEQELNGKQTGVLGPWGFGDIANMD